MHCISKVEHFIFIYVHKLSDYKQVLTVSKLLIRNARNSQRTNYTMLKLQKNHTAPLMAYVTFHPDLVYCTFRMHFSCGAQYRKSLYT